MSETTKTPPAPHTPGPWMRRGPYIMGPPIDPPYLGPIHIVATIARGPDLYPGEAEANAVLIATAPSMASSIAVLEEQRTDLLAACEAADAVEAAVIAMSQQDWPTVAVLCASLDVSTGLDPDETLAALQDKADDLRHAAIAKAKGGTL